MILILDFSEKVKSIIQTHCAVKMCNILIKENSNRIFFCDEI
jgi:hypothetical protein